ncbi:MAG: NAD(P)/FAD-dependent oxidoreductase, partial [Verrucomicrobiales bacterium]
MSTTIAILGGGPAGATFAALLAQHGLHPVLFADEKAPDLLVGESLIPAIVPLLRRLGIEDRVAAISQLKPGVSFVHPKAKQDMDFTFESVEGVLPTYAYNVPRPAFDQLLANRAEELGVEIVKHRALVEPNGAEGLRLTDTSLAAAPSLEGRQPDWVIDATGRHRHFARTLKIPATEGPRKDIAYFAHYDGCHHPKAEGQVIITRLETGWSWRIPLAEGRMSIGVVMDRDAAKALGDTPETRLA